MIIEVKKEVSSKMSKMMGLLLRMKTTFGKTLFSVSNKKQHKFIKPKRRLSRNINIKIYKILDIKCLEFTPKGLKNNKHIIYLHGGAFIQTGQQNHYNFLASLNDEFKGKITYIDYPIAPKLKVLDVLMQTEKVIVEVIKNHPEDEFYMMGDSAGGNLALNMLKAIPNTFKNVVLLSPWVDLSMSNNDISSLEEDEFMYTKDELFSAALSYAGEIPVSDKRVSPIYNYFPEDNIIIYAGMRDICFPDISLFEKKNNNVLLKAYHGLPHVFPVFPKTEEQGLFIKDVMSYLE